ncbi:HD domain-containing phosphohydrolase [Gallaecimonas sp. GXIMD1310]|uniref:HD domain-containing phosphohydrolase n=1 Tax=Gallaecimonas sp. GXIMD1310 TaxID=3131926 RepID=UPI003244905C
MRWKIPPLTIRFTVLSTFLIVAGITALVALGMQYHFSRQLAMAASENQFLQISHEVSERATELDKQAASLTHLLELSGQRNQPLQTGQLHPLVPLMAGAMGGNNHIYSMFVGYPDGNSLMLINLVSSPASRQRLQAAPEDRWVAIEVTRQGGHWQQAMYYLDDSLKTRVARQQPSHYDARNRPWYKMAQGKHNIIKTPPYLFSLIHMPGISYAKQTQNGQVVGVDVALSGMSGFLDRQNFSDDGDIFLFNGHGQITTYRQKHSTSNTQPVTPVSLTPEQQQYIKEHPLVRVSNELDWPPFDFAVSGVPKGYVIDYLYNIGQKTGLRFEFVNGYSYAKLTELFKAGQLDILQPLFKSKARQQYGTFSRPILPARIVAITRQGGPAFSGLGNINQLRIAAPVDFALSRYLVEHYGAKHMVPVDNTLDGLQAVQQGKADVLFEMQSVTDYLINYYFLTGLHTSKPIPALADNGNHSLHFMLQKNQPVLLSIINAGIGAMTPAERQQLQQRWLTPRAKQKALSSSNSLALGQLPRPILTLAQQGQQGLQEIRLNGRAYFVLVRNLHALYGGTEYIGMMVPVKQYIKPYMAKVKVSLLITMLVLALFVPLVFYLVNIIVKPIRLLIEENNKVTQRRFDEVKPVHSRVKEIMQLTRSMVFMARSIERYEHGQQELMDAFIQLLAQAIDQKSPYTGGHCARVPELGIMLAEAASNCSDGNLADFKLQGKEQWREFKVAAWLHDCGKVTTPEHIVDKGSKLECIYNRIHEVRMRFEVLWRDARISYLEALQQQPENQPELARQLAKRQQTLLDDFDFVAQCNIGSESMAPENITRLERIGAQQWQRHFDDQLGLSPEERRHFKTQSAPLPCTEPLLADRPEHIIARTSVIERDEKFGFDMPAPAHKQNRGELYNLSIRSGTLTAEDRYIINEHIITTIQMLETLPLPDDLKRVPEYAGGHHETLIGTGYPRKLSAEQLSIPARILAIADVFEALTAGDRPYKEGKTLTQSLDILHRLSEKQHIDKQLFELFLTSGVYLQYARKYMPANKIDAVDIARYLA